MVESEFSSLTLLRRNLWPSLHLWRETEPPLQSSSSWCEKLNLILLYSTAPWWQEIEPLHLLGGEKLNLLLILYLWWRETEHPPHISSGGKLNLLLIPLTAKNWTSSSFLLVAITWTFPTPLMARNWTSFSSHRYNWTFSSRWSRDIEPPSHPISNEKLNLLIILMARNWTFSSPWWREIEPPSHPLVARNWTFSSLWWRETSCLFR